MIDCACPLSLAVSPFPALPSPPFASPPLASPPLPSPPLPLFAAPSLPCPPLLPRLRISFSSPSLSLCFCLPMPALCLSLCLCLCRCEAPLHYLLVHQRDLDLFGDLPGPCLPEVQRPRSAALLSRHPKISLREQSLSSSEAEKEVKAVEGWRTGASSELAGGPKYRAEVSDFKELVGLS